MARLYLVLLCGALISCHASQHVRRMVVLGIDGMDPGFVERHWDALPNLAKLRKEGRFTRLATTTPPQSPVAWSTFITGLEPAEHGIFDFVHRDPDTLEPFSSLSRTEPSRFVLPLGAYRFPLSKTRIVSLRHGTPFWQTLAEHAIPVTIMRMPTNYPPVEKGHALSGMGTPDLRGTQGTFTFYTNDPEEISRPVPGGRIVAVRLEQGHVVLPLEGPPNTLYRDQPYATADVVVDVDQEQPVARLQLGEKTAILKEGEWSDWLAADFPLISRVVSVRGIFRVFAKQLHHGFELYVSAINADPFAPALPVSWPAAWSKAVAGANGRFFTLGIPEDTAAVRQKVLSLADFNTQTRLIFKEEHQLLRYSLQHSREGLLFFYFSVIDQSSHMLWGRHEADLLAVYRAVDGCIGEVRHAAPHADLIILSDHGFTSFDRAVHLNAWLQHRGFLVLNGVPRDDSTLSNLDRSATEAYALGLNGLYVNRKGSERRAILTNLRNQLLAWRDPADGRQIVSSVSEIHATPATARYAPALIVGYAPGYRASWQTGVGATPAEELENNRDAWIGDHCIDPSYVPGVLFTNFGFASVHPGIRDVTNLILQRFHIREQARQ